MQTEITLAIAALDMVPLEQWDNEAEAKVFQIIGRSQVIKEQCQKLWHRFCHEMNMAGFIPDGSKSIINKSRTWLCVVSSEQIAVRNEMGEMEDEPMMILSAAYGDSGIWLEHRQSRQVTVF